MNNGSEKPGGFISISREGAKPLPFILLTGALLFAAAAPAQEEAADKGAYLWRLCPSGGLAPLPEPSGPAPAAGEIHIDADTIESAGETVAVLSGDVTVTRPEDRIAADRVSYSQAAGHMELTGNVRYRGEDVEFNAESMEHDTTGLKSRAEELAFFLPGIHGRGGAESLVRREDGIIELDRLTYTTCPPGDTFWQFRADHLKLDREEGFGVARHTTLRLKDVPVLYFPVLSFPIDDRRKTGFLFPTAGDSSRHGFEVEAPWYWNIAPQADATFTPHHMSRRGVKLDTEWRYLNRWSENRLETGYLDDEVFGDVRSLLALRHAGRLGRHWTTSLSGAHASDREYFEDFGNSISDTGRRYLSRTAQLTGRWEHWRLASRLQSYQTLDERITGAREPYRLVPDMELTGLYPDFAAGLDFELSGSYTVFDHDERVNARRLDMWPRLSRVFGGPGWFFTPAVSRRYTRYQLEYPEGVPAPAGQDPEPVRSVPVTSLDAGLIFERDIGDEGRYLQTLEPRIFYLNVPFREQDDIPDFDTRRPDFSLYQLFEENRFVGADRMGDTEQLSLALSTRFLERLTGEERLRLSLGQIRYYEDRQVTLSPGAPPETAERSGLILEAESRFGGAWSATLSGERNPDTDRMDQGLFRLRYARESRRVFNLSYRYRRPDASGGGGIRQSDVTFHLPVGGRWSLAGRWNYEIDREVELEKFFGVEYESCCWAFRVLGRRALVDTSASDPDEREFDEGIYFELSLKGLGQPGSGVGRRLEQSIIGYQDPFK